MNTKIRKSYNKKKKNMDHTESIFMQLSSSLNIKL